jgi:hypothetical protein
MSPVATAQARWEAPAEAAPPPRVAIAPAQSAERMRPRPDPNRIPARPVRQARPAPAPLAPANDVAADPDGTPDTLESALRGWSTGDGLVASAAARQRPAPRRGVFWTAALLLASGAAGGLIAVQWLAPHANAVAATAPVPAVAVASVAPAPTAGKAVAPAATAAVGQAAANPAVPVRGDPGPALGSGAALAALPAAAGNAPPQPGQVSPGSLAALSPPAGAASAPSTPAAPSWAVEDDPTAFQPASAARPMVITADVDLRSGPDAKFTSLGVLKAGSVVPVSNCTQWCAVTVNGASGWVFYSFLADPALATPTAAATVTTTASK